MHTPATARPDMSRGYRSTRDVRTTRKTRRRADLRDIRVATVMSQPPALIESGLGLDVALQSLAAHGHRHLVVVNAGVYAGLVSDRVVASHWAAEPMRFENIPVGEVCEGVRPCVGPDASLGDAARMMRRCDTDAVVVIDDTGFPIGVVTTTDIVALMAKPRRP